MQFWCSLAFAKPEELVPLAQAAEAAGFEGVTVSDHFFYAEEYRSAYPYQPDGKPPYQRDTPWPDAWVTIGHLAAVTERLRFVTNVYVAPARDLFTVAKAVSTAAVLSDERVVLGTAPGWCEDEFLQTGQHFGSRGKRLTEMVGALRELWTGGIVNHTSAYFDFPDLSINPVPKEPIPVWIGGDSPYALKRAAAVGDGWIGTMYAPEDAHTKLDEVDAALASAGRADDPDFARLIALLTLDTSVYAEFEDRITGLIHSPWMLAPEDSLEARLDAMAEFGRDVIGSR